ncbi:MAG: hypothetical protein UY70_C0001G0027 [Candidatus Kaiserbacteria bacterium GW2011_GWB1_52_6]|uniref:Uncharacterized protein n=3 Tax=Candidatus Kaiseribacteriota TaxID=1752734 RepID=A0A0G1XJX5_9BACT|nr:MAG: hypothetical protein UY67_C0007G0027 [Candidatus Kaiserbacteria bacterium GW2011_GWA2_52_12]KKW28191.1 MAG: hypothetical protein UY70_C0001G0027 [Candidatus Kaiserbacteria bacterium GW2011_GWB1_52_6]KKW31160.1 MAG: hypothetical protein UY74_C0022G0016 [Candidatus Kaiserbacteria bacterium GW2011_GWC2_52_8b]
MLTTLLRALFVLGLCLLAYGMGKGFLEYFNDNGPVVMYMLRAIEFTFFGIAVMLGAIGFRVLFGGRGSL